MFHIVTQRLLLKEHGHENLARLNAWFNDAGISYFDGDEPPKEQPESLEETAKLLERILNRKPEDGILDYAIHRREDELMIGYGMIAHIDAYNRHCDLGVTIGEKQEWGKGYAREALQAVIAYCFNELGLNRIGAEIYDFNQRSLRLFEGLGFHRDGVLRQYVFKDGVFKDQWVFSLLRKEWEGSSPL